MNAPLPPQPLWEKFESLRAALSLANGIAQQVISQTKFDESQVSDWRQQVEDALFITNHDQPSPDSKEAYRLYGVAHNTGTEEQYAKEIHNLRNVVQSGIHAGQIAMIESWNRRFPDKQFPLPEPKAVKLNWTEPSPPNADCHYHHIRATTPFGPFLMTWKGYKEHPMDSLGFDETPWGDVVYQGWASIDEAKAWAEQELASRAAQILKP